MCSDTVPGATRSAPTSSDATCSRGSWRAPGRRCSSPGWPPCSTLLLAVPLGIVAGYRGGWVDTAIARTTDIHLAFPALILAVGLAAIFGPSLSHVTIALAVAGMPHSPASARGETLALREREFVKAAVVSGAGTATVVFRHILPNMTSILLVQAAMHIPIVIVQEAALSFLTSACGRRLRPGA